MALNYITSIATGQSIFVETTTAGAPTATASRGSVAIVSVAGATEIYLNTSAGATGNTWTLVGAGSASAVSFDPTSSGLKVPSTGAFVSTVQQAIDAIAAGEIVATFVFNPNAAADVGNVYNDFATLYAAFSRVPNGVRRRIQFIQATAGTTTIPAGSYDFRNAEWVGDPAQGNVQTLINVADGAVISGSGNARPPWLIESLYVAFLGTTPFCAVSTGVNTIWLDKGTVLDSNGATQSPFVATNPADGFDIHMLNSSRLPNSPVPVFQLVGAALGSTLTLYDNASVESSTLSVDAGSLWTIYVNGAASSYNTTQSGAGAYTVNYAPFNYVPAVIADWSGIAPTSIQNALDRIAAALGPIA